MQIVVSNLLITYSRSGTGRQVLVLPGWGDSSAGWRQFEAALSKSYEVIVPDLPGFGGSQAPGDAWGLTEYANFVAAFVKKVGIQPFALVGHSNGGAIAIRGLASATLQADRLVLLAAAGIRGEYKGRTKALRVTTKAGKLLTKPLPGRVRNKLRHKIYHSIGSDMLVAEHLQETFKNIVTDDVRHDAGRLDLPTLLIYGEDDEQTPARYGEMYHELIAGSTLEILPQSGHFVHLDRPADVLRLVGDFLS